MPTLMEGTRKSSSEVDVEPVGGLLTGATPRQPLAYHEEQMAQKEEKMIVRKIDLNILPILTVLFLFSFLDRTSIGNARIAGLGTELKLEGLKFSTAVSLFYVSYCVVEIFANVAMRFTSARWLLAGTMLGWGFITLITGFVVESYADLLVTRFFLGLSEGFFVPCAHFFILVWYPHDYWMTRIAVFWVAPTVAGAFGGLIARGCASIQDPNRSSWRYIYIIEGAVTLLVAIGAMFLLPDTLRKARFLKESERDYWGQRLEESRGSRQETDSKHHVLQAFLDWKVWLFGASSVALIACVTALAVFLPTIIANLGYTNNTAQFLTVPVYAAACISTLFFGWLARKTKVHGPYVLFCLALGIIATGCLQRFKTTGVQFGLTFMLAIGMFPTPSLTLTWLAASLHPSTKRGVGLGINIACANTGGVMASFLFLPKDAPNLYEKGHFALMICCLVSFMIALLFVCYFRLNSLRRPLLEEDLIRYAALTPLERAQEDLKGDRAMNFRYTL
ncbi:MAG: hypothetical protein M1837_006860 [Sclerophora amabilis]|nr:MAG: hypothetical protein M1837_006860 [Sclerophora amabilis]